jgi:hypothetical protein
MATQKLTSAFIKTATANGKEREVFWDSALPSFGLVVTERGAKSFVAQAQRPQSSRDRQPLSARVENQSAPLIASPIRTQRTGFQKIAQVLSDVLLRDLSKPPLSRARKLVVFSDSRQDADVLGASEVGRIIGRIFSSATL